MEWIYKTFYNDIELICVLFFVCVGVWKKLETDSWYTTPGTVVVSVSAEEVFYLTEQTGT